MPIAPARPSTRSATRFPMPLLSVISHPWFEDSNINAALPRSAKPIPYTILSAPPMVNCRSRVKVIGVVTPSPVGVAMLKLR